MQLNLDSLLKAAEYGQLLHMSEHLPLDFQLANPAISYAESSQLNGKAQCDVLASSLDSNVRGIIAVSAGGRPHDAQTRKKRKHDPAGLDYPNLNDLRKKINQGQGGDLSFQDSPRPVICKQSCTYYAVPAGTKDLREGNHYVFKSYQISPVEHIPSPQASCVPVCAINTPATLKGNSTTHLLLTAASHHKLKSKCSHGQLFGAGPDIENMLLKVCKIDPAIPQVFEVQLSSKVALEQIEQISQSLASGQLQIAFRETWKPNLNKILLHTVLDTAPATYLSPAATPTALTNTGPSTSAADDLGDFPLLLHGLASSSGFASNSAPYLEASELVVAGNATVHGTLQYGKLLQLSDAHVKHNISDTPAEALQKLQRLRPVTYDLLHGLKEQQQVGFIAQNVKQVFPKAVADSQDSDLLGIDPYALLVYTIQSIQELYGEFQQRDVHIKELQAKDTALGLEVLQLTARTQQLAHSQLSTDPETEASADSQQEACSVLQSPSCGHRLGYNTLAPDSTNLGNSTQADISNHTLPDTTTPTDSAESAQAQAAAFDGLTEPNAVVQWMLRALQEENPHVGIMFKRSLSKLGQSAVWACFQAIVPGLTLPPGATTKLIKLLKQCEQEASIRQKAAGESCNMGAPLRSYQQLLIEACTASGNHIVVLPTGTGKTRIVVELSRQLLQAQPTSRILFLTATVTLAQQQAAVFEASLQAGKLSMECFTRENPVTPQKWRIALADVSVIVMTAQSLLNMLQQGEASFQQIAMLVLDECHHCHSGHPFSAALGCYRRQSLAEQLATKVIGLTATPGEGSSYQQAYAKQEMLRRNMCADFLSVRSGDAEVMKYAPKAEQLTFQVVPRAQDGSFASNLAAVVLLHARSLAFRVSDNKEASALMHEVAPVLQQCACSPKLEGWLNELLSPASSLPIALQSYASLLRSCNTVLSLIRDTGYEVGLHMLGLRCNEASQASQQHASAALSDALGQTSELPHMSVAGLVRDLAAHVIRLPLVAAALSASVADTTPAFPKFQKLVQILTEQKASKAAWHGMVFVKERQGVLELTQMLQNCPDLAGIIFHPFTGQGNGARQASVCATGAFSPAFDCASARGGMKSKEAKAAFQAFLHGSGHRVLVSTAAAEEGIDVPSCELVVCYTVPQSGRELTQRRGRVRGLDSRFAVLLELGSSDTEMYKKACQEQSHSQLAQKFQLMQCN